MGVANVGLGRLLQHITDLGGAEAQLQRTFSGVEKEVSRGESLVGNTAFWSQCVLQLFASELVIWRRANPLIDVENVGISEPEMPGGFKSWRRLGMKAIFLRDALKVSLVPVMWSTEIGGHLSCPYYVVEASAVLFLEPSEGDVCVPSNFRGVCYVKVIRLTMEVVSAMGQLRKERRVGKKRLGLNERDKVDKSLGKERSARLETKKLLEEFNDYTNKCERNIMYIVQMVEGPLDLSDVELDCCWSVV
ncbi:hypothetical protein V6N12_062486 [Hibiscus sabdariffa]|uniref:Uncharacterized protein n=1 Tax=Hibiscus sabdariffa TaxID=183260 RepID=A0ABR2F8Z9_9ROSI